MSNDATALTRACCIDTLAELQCLTFQLRLNNLQGASLEDVSRVLRARFGTSGIEEKAARPPK
jgi:hypothetical protein